MNGVVYAGTGHMPAVLAEMLSGLGTPEVVIETRVLRGEFIGVTVPTVECSIRGPKEVPLGLANL